MAKNPANKIKNPLLCDNRLFILLGQRPFYEIISFYYNAIKPQITSQRERPNSDILITTAKKEGNIMQLIANYNFKLQQNANLLNELVTGLVPFADYFQELVKVVNLQIKIEKEKSL